jgi:hypothetical protein
LWIAEILVFLVMMQLLGCEDRQVPAADKAHPFREGVWISLSHEDGY